MVLPGPGTAPHPSDERYWFEVVVTGGPLNFWPEGENGDWRVQPDEPAAEVLAAYHRACA
jgi:hypothetical protein